MSNQTSSLRLDILFFCLFVSKIWWKFCIQGSSTVLLPVYAARQKEDSCCSTLGKVLIHSLLLYKNSIQYFCILLFPSSRRSTVLLLFILKQAYLNTRSLSLLTSRNLELCTINITGSITYRSLLIFVCFRQKWVPIVAYMFLVTLKY